MANRVGNIQSLMLGTDVERVFAFAAECTAQRGVRVVLDAPYRAYVWEALVAHPDVYVGVATKRATQKNERRTSVLGKAKPASLAPDRIAPGPLAALQDMHGDALRIAVDVQRVRRLLTGTDDENYLSPAAYVVLQHVSRARATGLTVVELGKVTHYDQKTVFYLVKALVERDMVYVARLMQGQVCRARDGARVQLRRGQGLLGGQPPVAGAAERAGRRGTCRGCAAQVGGC